MVAHLIEEEDPVKPTFEWTRIFTRDNGGGKQVGLFQLGADLRFDSSMRDALDQASEFQGEILFSPLEFKAQDLPSDLSECRLDSDTLMYFGKLATKVIDQFASAKNKL